MRTRLAISTALASIVLGGYCGRKAYAGSCTSAGAGTYTCTGAAGADVTQALTGIPLSVTTAPGFGIDTAAGDAFTLTGSGGLTFSDNNYSAISGYDDGIYAKNYGSGALSITTTGLVEGETRNGIVARNYGTDLTIKTAAVTGSGYGIDVENYGSGALSITSTGPVTGDNGHGILARNEGTDLTINTAAVTGGLHGIDAHNDGSGTLSITSTDLVWGKTFDGINAYNSTSGTVLTINTAAVTGDFEGIKARNHGSGALSITSKDLVYGSYFDGIDARNYGTDLTINTAAVAGEVNGILAVNKGSGALSITSKGPVVGSTLRGISAYNSASGTDLTIETASVTGGRDGVLARNFGSGDLSITTDGAIMGGSGFSIRTYTNAGNMTLITLNSGASVEATSGVAITNNEGDSQTTVNAGASVTGDIMLGDGSDDLTFDGGDFSLVTLFDGGDDSDVADGWIDHLTFANVSGTIATASMTYWESTTVSNSIMVFDGDFVAPSVLNVIGGSFLTVDGNFTNGGLVSMQDGTAHDLIVIEGNYDGAGGNLAMDAEFETPESEFLAVMGDVVGETPTTISVKGWGEASDENILLMTVFGDTNSGDFVLDDRLIGAYLFDLELIDHVSLSRWYLTNPVWSPNTPAYEAYPQILAALNTLPTLQQRIGDRYFTNSRSAASTFADDLQPGQQSAGSTNGGINDTGNVSSANNGIWARIEGAHAHIEPKSSSTASNYDIDTWKVQAGADVLLHENSGGMLIGGINGYYGSASADIVSMFGNGMVDTDARGVGAALTWYGNDGFYTDGQAQWSWFDSDLSSSAFGSLTIDNEGSGHAYSLEIGKRIEGGSGFTFTPQAQLVYGEVDFDTFSDNVNAAVVSLGEADSLRLRMGIAAERSYGSADAMNYGASQTRLHAIANLYYDFDNQTTLSVAGAPLSSELDGWTGEIGVGGTFASADNAVALYGQATVTSSLEDIGASYAYMGTAGLRVNF